MTSSALRAPTDTRDIARVFDSLDVSEATRQDHKWRIGGFINYLQGRPLTGDSYLEFKRSLATRTDLSIATKNKYLVSARVLLRELTTLLQTYRGDTLEVRRYTRHDGTEMLQIYDDRRRHRADLPRFYDAFRGVAL